VSSKEGRRMRKGTPILKGGGEGGCDQDLQGVSIGPYASDKIGQGGGWRKRERTSSSISKG